jgi:uncharacterized membrane protein
MRHLAGEVLSGHKPSARIEVIVSTLAGLIPAIPVTVLSSPEFGFLAGWNTATAVYLAWVWMMVWPRDAKQTARWAEYTDPTRALADLLVLTAAVASLVAVGFVLVHAAQSQGMWELMPNEIRRTALRHALLSYLFGTGILATTINLVASLTSR